MRLITSGCSFTSFRYPTWPWFLADAYDETYNYGQSGAGNEYIFNSIVAADSDLHFREDDIVIVAWSGFYRYDTFREPWANRRIVWVTDGEWSWNPKFRELEPWVSEVGWEHKSLNYMLATARYLKARNIKYLFTSLFDLRLASHLHQHTVSELHSQNFIFPEGLDQVTKGYRKSEYIKNYLRGSAKKVLGGDGHPDLMEHLRTAGHIADRLGLTITKYTDESLRKCNEQSLNITPGMTKQVSDYLESTNARINGINPIYNGAYKLSCDSFPQYKNFFDTDCHIK